MFMKILTCIAIAVTAGTIASCEDGDDFVAISGTVIDSLTKAPIDSAWIAPFDTMHGIAKYTDAAGNYSVTMFPHLRVWLYVGKAGYSTKSRYFLEVRENEPGVNFELAPDTL